MIERFDAHCRTKGIPVFAPVVRHMCSPHCKMWQVKESTGEPIFICTFSRKLHYCGNNCKHYHESNNSEGYVCSLTSWVLPMSIEKNHITLSKDFNCRNKYKNDNKIVMGKRSARQRPSLKTTKSAFIFSSVVAMLTEIFTKKRTNSTFHLAKFLKRCAKESRSIQKKQCVDYLSLHRVFFTHLKSYPSLIRGNTKIPISTVRINQLAKQIMKYHAKLDIPWTMTLKTTNTLVAVIVSKLSTGYKTNDIVVFPKVDWIAQCAPREIEYSGIKGLQCRAMSILWRKLQAIIISSKSGLPSHAKIFRLDGT